MGQVHYEIYEIGLFTPTGEAWLCGSSSGSNIGVMGAGLRVWICNVARVQTMPITILFGESRVSPDNNNLYYYSKITSIFQSLQLIWKSDARQMK